MNRRIKIALASLAAATVAVGFLTVTRGETELFDEKRSARDLEVMCGILNTSVNYAVRELGAPLGGSNWRSGSINGYYLYKQGAVFFVPVPALSVAGPGGGAYAVGAGSAYSTAVAEYELARSLDALGRSEDPEADPDPVGETLARLALAGKSEEERKEIEDRLAKKKEHWEQQVRQYRQKLAQLERELLEIVGQYGSTLTQVQRDEYVTLALVPSGGFGRTSGPTRMLSVPRSAIADYGAGRLTLDQLETKVLRYSSGGAPSTGGTVFSGGGLFDTGGTR